mmetsp:Transcript_29547/g.74319  ORF Transcript_29547/g.74319 Transcript_29547/m.74319 type:complete len:232 (-) Transcript_29547:886-1581(-)
MCSITLIAATLDVAGLAMTSIPGMPLLRTRGKATAHVDRRQPGMIRGVQRVARQLRSGSRRRVAGHSVRHVCAGGRRPFLRWHTRWGHLGVVGQGCHRVVLAGRGGCFLGLSCGDCCGICATRWLMLAWGQRWGLQPVMSDRLVGIVVLAARISLGAGAGTRLHTRVRADCVAARRRREVTALSLRLLGRVAGARILLTIRAMHVAPAVRIDRGLQAAAGKHPGVAESGRG